MNPRYCLTLAPRLALSILTLATATGAQASNGEAAVAARTSQPSVRTERVVTLPMMPATLPERPNDSREVTPLPLGRERITSRVPLLSEQWRPERPSVGSPPKPSLAVERREAKLPSR